MPASLKGELQPTIYRFKLGEFEVATVLDAKAIRDGLHPHYGANASPDEVHALARANNIDTQRFEHPNIPTLVNTGKQLVLFDTGNGALPREYEQLSKRLPPGPLADRSKFIKPGDQVAPGITAVDAAGHSPGLLAFHVESAGKRVMITADTCTQFVMAVQRPEWHFEMDDDKEKAVTTRKRILDMLAMDKIFVASFHMPFPGLGYIDKGQGGYRWVPHSYQLNL